MSLTTLLPPVIVPSIIPRSFMDMNLLERPLGLGLSSLDLFDPFDEVDRMLSSNISWLNQPLSLIPALNLVPRVPEKHRISISVPGFRDESSIKTEVKDNKLIVSAREGEPAISKHDYDFHEFKRTVELPHNLDTKNLVSFKVGDTLIVEIPIKQTQKQLDQLVPVIEDAGSGQKRVSLNVVIPDNIDPSKVSVTLKDRDVVIQGSYREKKQNTDTSVYYMRRSSLPINTDLNSLRCTAQNGNQLRIEANLGENPNKSVPIKIENLPQLQQQQQQQLQQQQSQGQQQSKQQQQQVQQQSKQQQQEQAKEQQQQSQGQQQSKQQQQEQEASEQQQQPHGQQQSKQQQQQQSREQQQQQGQQKQSQGQQQPQGQQQHPQGQQQSKQQQQQEQQAREQQQQPHGQQEQQAREQQQQPHGQQQQQAREQQQQQHGQQQSKQQQQQQAKEQQQQSQGQQQQQAREQQQHPHGQQQSKQQQEQQAREQQKQTKG